MTTENARSLAEFSLSPFFRRQWSSTYEAMEDCRPNGNKLMKRYIQEIPTLTNLYNFREIRVSRGKYRSAQESYRARENGFTSDGKVPESHPICQSRGG